MKKLLLGLLITTILSVSCKKENEHIVNYKVDIFMDSDIGLLKMDETNWSIQTDGDILDTVNNSIHVNLISLDNVIVESEYVYDNMILKLTNTTTNKENSYDMDGYVFLTLVKDTFVLIN